MLGVPREFLYAAQKARELAALGGSAQIQAAFDHARRLSSLGITRDVQGVVDRAKQLSSTGFTRELQDTVRRVRGLSSLGITHDLQGLVHRVNDFASLGIASSYLEAVRNQQRFQRLLRSIKKSGQRAEAMLVAIGWPPPGHLPAALMDEITSAFAIGDLSAADAEKMIVEYYCTDRVNEIYADWEQSGRLTRRLPILREALRAHNEGKYALSIPTLIPQVEGVIAEVFGHVGPINGKKVKDYIRVAFGRGSSFDRAGAAFFVGVLYDKFEWGSPIPVFSRHAIMHGADTDYATEANSLRAILFLDQLQQSVGYVASPRGRSFHLVACRSLKGKGRTLHRSYSNPYDATSDGLQPCRHCLPHLVEVS